MNLGLQFLVWFIAIMAVVWVIERFAHRRSVWNRRNRYRSNFLPPPSSNCVVGDSWKAATQQRPRF